MPVLIQEDRVDHPVCYFFKKFVKCQLNHSTIEKETLILLMVLQCFELYLGESPTLVHVYTNHIPLVFLGKNV